MCIVCSENWEFLRKSRYTKICHDDVSTKIILRRPTRYCVRSRHRVKRAVDRRWHNNATDISFSVQMEGRQRHGCRVGNIWWQSSCCISPDLVYTGRAKNAANRSAVWPVARAASRSRPSNIARGEGLAVHARRSVPDDWCSTPPLAY